MDTLVFASLVRLCLLAKVPSFLTMGYTERYWSVFKAWEEGGGVGMGTESPIINPEQVKAWI